MEMNRHNYIWSCSNAIKQPKKKRNIHLDMAVNVLVQVQFAKNLQHSTIELVGFVSFLAASFRIQILCMKIYARFKSKLQRKQHKHTLSA